MDELEELGLIYTKEQIKKMLEEAVPKNVPFKGKILIIGTGGEDSDFTNFKNII